MTSMTDAYQATDGAAYEVFLGRRSRRLAEKLLDFAAFGDDGPRAMSASAWAVRGIVS